MDVNFRSLESWATGFLRSLSSQVDTKSAVQSAVIAVACYVVISRLYKGFFGPLSDVPGPILRRLIDLPLSQERGKNFVYILKLHEQYGPIVRLNPNKISVADKDLLKQILVKQDLPKGPNYKMAMVLSGHQTLFNTVNRDFHKQRRRILSPAFSVQYLTSLEPYMFEATESMMRKIKSDVEKSADGHAVLDIWNMLQRLALDIIGETAFGKTFGMIENGTHPLPGLIAENMRRSALLGQYPFLQNFKDIFPSLIKPNPYLREFMTTVIKDRVKSGERRNDILQILIDSQSAKDVDDRLLVDDIIQETILFLIAGSETTSNSTGFGIIYLLQNPDKLAKLVHELDTELDIPPGQALPSHESLKHLPYLNAVITETLRLRPVAAGGLQRQPAEDIMLGRHFVPKGTVVHANMWAAQLDPNYWPNPKAFSPERFLEDAVSEPAMDAYYPFSAGSRNCIGKNFALMEMRLTFATLFNYFSFELIPSELPKLDNLAQFVTLTVQANSFDIKASVRTEKWAKLNI